VTLQGGHPFFFAARHPIFIYPRNIAKFAISAVKIILSNDELLSRPMEDYFGLTSLKLESGLDDVSTAHRRRGDNRKF
jgi:hypothetical protein